MPLTPGAQNVTCVHPKIKARHRAIAFRHRFLFLGRFTIEFNLSLSPYSETLSKLVTDLGKRSPEQEFTPDHTDFIQQV